MQVQWKMLHPRMTIDHLGLIPEWLDDNNPQSAKEQIDQNYQHGGGWRSFKGFKMNEATKALSYPGDPPMKPLAQAELRGELVLFYEHAWVAIVQTDGTFDVARID